MRGFPKRATGVLCCAAALITFPHLSFSAPASEEKGAQALMFPVYRIENPTAGNGIAVGVPKVFDNRSLALKLEELNASLAKLSMLDQAKIFNNIGTLQGIIQKEVARAATISTLPLPGTSLTEKRDTNTAQLVADQRVTTNAAFPSSIPDSGASGLPAIDASKYGIAAQDILSEEMNLNYQILNLRMLLERSISDRLNTNGTPRPQVVVGFQVSIDPMEQHKGSAAVVEVDIAPNDPQTKKSPPTLVALMPEAKTYNVAALSKSANSFGASAVVKVVSIGYSEKHTSQQYFLYRDTDTVAFERPIYGTRTNLTFGWAFRPVLNRRAVEPGLRQVFAVISLDEEDLEAAQKGDFKVNLRVRTYWTKFDKKNAVVSSEPREEKCFGITNFSIPRSLSVQEGLGPRVNEVKVSPISDGKVLIDVAGDNFYHGTVAVMEGAVLDQQSPNLLLKSDQLLQIIAPIQSIVKDRIYLTGC